MNFDSISDFISFVNDTKKYEGALASLKTQQEAITEALGKQQTLGAITKVKEAAEALQAKAVEDVAKAQVQADKLIADATVVYDKRHQELKEREILAEQAIRDFRTLQGQWANKQAEFQLAERNLSIERQRLEKAQVELAEKQIEVDQRLDKLRKAMG